MGTLFDLWYDKDINYPVLLVFGNYLIFCVLMVSWHFQSDSDQFKWENPYHLKHSIKSVLFRYVRTLTHICILSWFVLMKENKLPVWAIEVKTWPMCCIDHCISYVLGLPQSKFSWLLSCCGCSTCALPCWHS